MRKYQPQTFENKWVEQWDKDKTYKAHDSNQFTVNSKRDPSTLLRNASDGQAGSGNKSHKKMYALSMFPYPSGAGLHVGHVRIYTGTDILARFFRMNGYNVMHPMGWDAFGLPAENAAIKAKKNPMDMVPDNIANFKRQMKSVGLSFDWDREFSTTDPSYYKWTQWLFMQFYKMGLLVKKDTPVFYCPFCKTGLAEEEVLPNGTHERCGNAIEKRLLPQWIFRITTYADRLLNELEGLNWPAGILEMQRNWIGRKEGINITYPIVSKQFTVNSKQDPSTSSGNKTMNREQSAVNSEPIGEITCFTTRPDTNFGATFVVLAPEHEFVTKLLKDANTPAEHKKSVQEYVDLATSKTDLERQAEGRKKTGVFTGYYAMNHVTGKEMPIWVSDFVLGNFGTGAVVGVPGHDIRDFEFASTFDIEIIRVVVGKDGDNGPITKKNQVQEKEGTMINSGFLDGMEIMAAKQKMMDYIEEKGWGKKVVSYHLRDWIFSRQRYWGEPIPMVHCETCAKKGISWWDTDDGKAFQKSHQNISKLDKEVQESMNGWFMIDEKSLPLELPYTKSYEPREDGSSPLASIDGWTDAVCPHCGGKAQRETDTMPNWAGSCWYFLRFADPHDDKQAWSPESMKVWEPVDWYLGGAEHAVLHLLYSRFWVKALQDLGLLEFNEPFMRLRNVGMVLAEDHRKMSKSWGNVINPDDVVAEYGADALRLYEMFMAPFNQENAWSTSALQGTYRFLKRIWDIYYKSGKIVEQSDRKSKDVEMKFYKTVQKVSNDIKEIKYNTAIAAMMEFLNEWEKEGISLSTENAKKFLQILAPFAPFMTEELWHEVMEMKDTIHLSTWPTIDESQLKEANVTIPVQVNGKMRGTIVTSVQDVEQDTVVTKALADDKISQFIGKEYKVIYVKGKILNFVVKG